MVKRIHGIKIFSILLIFALILPMVAVVKADIPRTNLKVYYKLDEGIGNLATDNSGNGYAGTLTGATWSRGIIWDNTTRSLGFCTVHSGTDQFIDIKQSPQTLIGNAHSFTVAGWYYPTSIATNSRTFFGSNTSTTDSRFWLQTSTAGALSFYYGTDVVTLTGVTITIAKWWHLTVTYNDTTNIIKLYVFGNNVFTSSALAGSELVGTADLYIGGLKSGATINPIQDYAGWIDEFVLYDICLSSTDVQYLYGHTGVEDIFPIPIEVFNNNTVDVTVNATVNGTGGTGGGANQNIAGITQEFYILINVALMLLGIVCFFVVNFLGMSFALVGIFFNVTNRSYSYVSSGYLVNVDLGQLVILPLLIFLIIFIINLFRYINEH